MSSQGFGENFEKRYIFQLNIRGEVTFGGKMCDRVWFSFF